MALVKEVENPQRKRRKEARPSEIVDAATSVFAENGYAGANLDEVARRAGVAKGTLYRYFETKEDLFRAVARAAVAVNFDLVESATSVFQGSIREFIPILLKSAAKGLGDSRIPAIARMVIGEARQFPDLARIWHDNVAARILEILVRALAEGQERGEVRPGNPHLQAFSLVGPMLTAILFREVFADDSDLRPNLTELAESHAEILLAGLLVQ